jgi:16S rRNA (guanine527-N7)-methyltransferase
MPKTASEFAKKTGVSRETLSRLECFADLLRKWQKSINLVGPSTVTDIWSRHMMDSAQLLPLVRLCGWQGPELRWADLGSGAGFPGLVLAIMGAGEVALIESNSKKCAFLRQVIRQTGATAEVVEARIEEFDGCQFDLIVSRALGPVNKLVEYARPLVREGSEIWLLKSQDVEDELTRTPISSTIEVESYASETDERGRILRLRGVG